MDYSLLVGHWVRLSVALTLGLEGAALLFAKPHARLYPPIPAVLSVLRQVGVDREDNVLAVAIIDFIRQYTWDKQLETWVKGSGLLGGNGKVRPPTLCCAVANGCYWGEGTVRWLIAGGCGEAGEAVAVAA